MSRAPARATNALLVLLMVWWAAACTEPLTAPARYYGTVLAEALDENLAPLAGVRVELRSAYLRVGSGTTDSAGAVRFDYIRPESYLMNVVAAPDGFILWPTIDNPILGIRVAPDQQTVVSVPLISLERAAEVFGRIVVQVVDEAGVPLPDVELELRSASRQVARGATGVDGTLQSGFLAPESYLVNVFARTGYILPRSAANPIVGVHVVGGEATRVGVRMIRVDRVDEHLGTVVLEAQDEVGVPLRGVQVELRNAQRHVQGATTSANGTVTFSTLEPESYLANIVAAPPGYVLPATAENPIVGIDVVAGATTRAGVRLIRANRVDAYLGRVLVEAVDAAGRPLAGVQLELRSAVRHVGGGVTGADGRLLFQLLEPESYLINVVAAPPGYRLPASAPNPILHVGVVPGEVTLVRVPFIGSG